MAVVVVGKAPSQEAYDGVSAKLMNGEQLPEGCQVHIAAQLDDGFRVITVWDSEEQFQSFRDEKLMPAMKEVVGEAVANAPAAEVHPVHRFLTA